MSVSDVQFCSLAYEGKLELMRSLWEGDPSLINARDTNMRTALHWASSSGKEEVVDWLLTQGAEVRRPHHQTDVRDSQIVVHFAFAICRWKLKMTLGGPL